MERILVTEEKMKLCRCCTCETDMCSTYRHSELKGEPFCVRGESKKLVSLEPEVSSCNCGNSSCPLAKEMKIDGVHFCHGNKAVSASNPREEVELELAPLSAGVGQTGVN